MKNKSFNLGFAVFVGMISVVVCVESNLDEYLTVKQPVGLKRMDIPGAAFTSTKK